jgi:hypothetical protein
MPAPRAHASRAAGRVDAAFGDDAARARTRAPRHASTPAARAGQCCIWALTTRVTRPGSHTLSSGTRTQTSQPGSTMSAQRAKLGQPRARARAGARAAPPPVWRGR